LQRFLEQIAFDASRQAQPETVYAAEIAEQAARLGVPLPIDQVRVAKSAEGGVFLEARYLVHVDLLVYTVDLHFRPSAGAR
jgi:hypothetical protein